MLIGLCTAQAQTTGPFDYIYPFDRVLVKPSERAQRLLQIDGPFLQVFYYNRNRDSSLPTQSIDSVFATYKDARGRTAILPLYDDGLHLDKDSADGIYANAYAGSLEELCQQLPYDDYDIWLDVQVYRKQYHVLHPGIDTASSSPTILTPQPETVVGPGFDAIVTSRGDFQTGGITICQARSPELLTLAAKAEFTTVIPQAPANQPQRISVKGFPDRAGNYLLAAWVRRQPVDLSGPSALGAYGLDAVEFYYDRNAPHPTVDRLFQNHPNPFRDYTFIGWYQATDGPVRLRIIDILGREVRILANMQVSPEGTHYSVWDGGDARGHRCGSGSYFCLLETKGTCQVTKLLLVR